MIILSRFNSIKVSKFCFSGNLINHVIYLLCDSHSSTESTLCNSNRTLISNLMSTRTDRHINTPKQRDHNSGKPLRLNNPFFQYIFLKTSTFRINFIQKSILAWLITLKEAVKNRRPRDTIHTSGGHTEYTKGPKGCSRINQGVN